METIFEHNVTNNEINAINKLIPGRRIDDGSGYKNSVDDDLRNADLCRLYFVRGNKIRADEYLNKIKDATLKYFLTN